MPEVDKYVQSYNNYYENGGNVKTTENRRLPPIDGQGHMRYESPNPSGEMQGNSD